MAPPTSGMRVLQQTFQVKICRERGSRAQNVWQSFDVCLSRPPSPSRAGSFAMLGPVSLLLEPTLAKFCLVAALAIAWLLIARPVSR